MIVKYRLTWIRDPRLIVGTNGGRQHIQSSKLAPGGECHGRTKPVGAIGVAIAGQVEESIVLKETYDAVRPRQQDSAAEFVPGHRCNYGQGCGGWYWKDSSRTPRRVRG